jgi:hypothetical protein
VRVALVKPPSAPLVLQPDEGVFPQVSIALQPAIQLRVAFA